jgi:predicted GIY-YIG superfamily endonuclease
MDCFVASLLAMTKITLAERKRMKQPCVYIMASKRHGTLYTGVTANLPKRAFEHREGLAEGTQSMAARSWSGMNCMTQ